MITGSEPVAVPHQQLFSLPFKFFGFKVYRYTELLQKVITHPHIVIAHKKMHGDPGIAEFSQFTEQSDIALGNHFPVFIPEIKKIPDQKDLFRILFDPVQKLNDDLFPFQAADRVGGTQVKI